MKEVKCKNCASSEFELKGTYLKCSYCGSWYIAGEFKTEQDFEMALSSLGFKVENVRWTNDTSGFEIGKWKVTDRDSREMIKITHPKLDKDEFQFMVYIWDMQVYYDVTQEFNRQMGVLN